MSGKEVKPSTVDKVAEKIKQNNPSLSSEKARAIARESAERINRNNQR
jgi:hypothetical protein